MIPFSFGFRIRPMMKLISIKVTIKNIIHSLMKVTSMVKLKVRKRMLGMMKAMTVRESQIWWHWYESFTFLIRDIQPKVKLTIER